jgi:hypothetical protein
LIKFPKRDLLQNSRAGKKEFKKNNHKHKVRSVASLHDFEKSFAYTLFEEATKMLWIFKARLMSNLTERFLDLNTFLSPDPTIYW